MKGGVEPGVWECLTCSLHLEPGDKERWEAVARSVGWTPEQGFGWGNREVCNFPSPAQQRRLKARG